MEIPQGQSPIKFKIYKKMRIKPPFPAFDYWINNLTPFPCDLPAIVPVGCKGYFHFGDGSLKQLGITKDSLKVFYKLSL